jgi:hypothetical protein
VVCACVCARVRFFSTLLLIFSHLVVFVDNVKYQKCHLGVIYFLLFVDSGHLASARIIFGLEVHVKWLSDTASGIVIIFF